MNIETVIALHNAYVAGRQMREAAMQQRAAKYSAEFEEQYKRRMERRAADRRQFLDVILPHIKEEASLRRYERRMGGKNV